MDKILKGRKHADLLVEQPIKCEVVVNLKAAAFPAQKAASISSSASSPQRAFEIDVLACPRCGGRLRLIATVEDPREIREVLADLARSAEPVDRAPPVLESLAANPTADVGA